MPTQPVVYYVAFFETCYDSLDDAIARAPDAVAAHRAHSQELHVGVNTFLNNQEEKLRTMAVLTTREAAEEYAKGDPFVLNGMVSTWYIREWANMFA